MPTWRRAAAPPRGAAATHEARHRAPEGVGDRPGRDADQRGDEDRCTGAEGGEDGETARRPVRSRARRARSRALSPPPRPNRADKRCRGAERALLAYRLLSPKKF